MNEEKGNEILNENNLSDAVYFIEDGEIEVYTTFEKNEFVLETLYRGSVINQRAIFMQDTMYVNMRCAADVKLLKLEHNTMKKLIEKYEDRSFGRELLIYQNKLLKKESKFPVDYVLHVPKWL